MTVAPTSILQIREVDSLQFRVAAGDYDGPTELLIGDHRAEFNRIVIEGKTCWQTPAMTYVSECFGHAVAVIAFSEGEMRIDFDVLAEKTTVQQARKMIAYLADKNEKLVASCFARSSHPTGSVRADDTPPETLLSAAEKFLQHLQERRFELLHHLRERLVPERVPLWQRRSTAAIEIDPIDVIGNLDALVPALGAGEVFLRGRHYNLSNIHITQLQSTHDVIENHILVGGLYSVRRKILNLQDVLREYEEKFKAGDTGDFESLSRLLLSLTAAGMLRRCAAILRDASGLIRMFRQYGVSYRGEIAPVMTAFARSTRVYRDLYADVAKWYELGTPCLSGIDFLLKLRSLHTIFEIFTLFHLIEEMMQQGWRGESMIPHPTFGSEVPASITLSMGEEHLTLQYEPVISPLSSSSAHMDLTDTLHGPGSLHPYWTPDFVMRFARGDLVRYLILDAKYSRRSTVSKYGLPSIVDKYFKGTAVYDAVNGLLTSDPIVGVFAVFALGDHGSHYLNMWNGNGVHDDVVRLPMAGGIGLMVDNSFAFHRCIAAATATTRRILARGRGNVFPARTRGSPEVESVQA
ncbi:hypothetical protein [Cupriavidus sp. D39]|uniref:hypothetical protein n=1 Tax=Cupriavidus sp. D39 TaxID=2997877 RepID=UPI0022716484|nr:hypothetical protein [Cupriavidus sp. D39]MCY0856640.1 hypothetical protein [Cupriavidus sp. D39]